MKNDYSITNTFLKLLELMIKKLFTAFPSLHRSDDCFHSFEEPIMVHSALGTLNTWLRAGVENPISLNTAPES